MKQISFMDRIGYAYERNHEPESRLLFADIYWYSALIWMVISFVVAVLLGGYMLLMTLGSIGGTGDSGTTQRPAFDATVLHTEVQTILTRGQQLPSELPAVTDPSQ